MQVAVVVLAAKMWGYKVLIRLYEWFKYDLLKRPRPMAVVPYVEPKGPRPADHQVRRTYARFF
jgi:hypothetical protein